MGERTSSIAGIRKYRCELRILLAHALPWTAGPFQRPSSQNTAAAVPLRYLRVITYAVHTDQAYQEAERPKYQYPSA